jgi:uncharacterized protein involved in type VI secretion and phage assembly
MIAQSTTHLVIGIVSELHPSAAGRVRVTFPHLDNTPSDWCSVVSPMGGPERGFVMLPEIGDHVLVGFEHGDPLRAFVLGSIWNRTQKIPAGGGRPADNNHRFIRSRSGHVLRFDDTPGGERIEIRDRSGKHVIVIDSAAGKIEIASDGGDVAVRATGKVAVEAAEVSIKAQGSITIEAQGQLTLKGATVNIN